MKSWPFALATAMLAVTSAFLASRAGGETAPPRTPFAELPLALADHWRGQELSMDKRVLDILRLTDHVMRVYVPVVVAPRPAAQPGESPQAAAPVWLYVGYYDSQRTGSTYHSPKNCLPGAGWQFAESTRRKVSVPGGEATVNRVIIEKGLDRQMVVYWYQDRGRVVASEYEAKAFLIWDAMTRNRTDGALVRLTTPVRGDDEAAFQHALAFLRDAWPLLRPHLPA